MSEENVIDFSLHLRRKQDSILDDADRRAGTWSPRATVAGFLSIEIEPDSDDASASSS